MHIKKLLIINQEQFGYHTDTYKYCEYLNQHFEIIYFCFDDGNKKITLPNMEVKYVPSLKSKIIRWLIFYIKLFWILIRFNGVIFIKYFYQCEYVKKIFWWKKMILDIRTLTVIGSDDYKKKRDRKIKHACDSFDKVTIISEGLLVKLNLQRCKTYILPLGADIISNSDKFFNNLKLLYVGTLTNRDIYKTIIGLKLFIEKYPRINISYDIVGDGDEMSKLIELVTKFSINRYVKFHGWVPYNELSRFFDHCNIGISFVPITDYYQFQPVTKTYEYILSGLYCIATATTSNTEIINSSNGMLIQDNALSFFSSLEKIAIHEQNINSQTIRNSLIKYQWKQIIEEYLLIHLNN